MKLGALACMVMGHKWRVDEASTDPEAHLVCLRCERHQLPPTDSAYNNRLRVETDRIRRTGRS
jgi:hypothetical protein